MMYQNWIILDERSILVVGVNEKWGLVAKKLEVCE